MNAAKGTHTYTARAYYTLEIGSPLVYGALWSTKRIFSRSLGPGAYHSEN